MTEQEAIKRLQAAVSEVGGQRAFARTHGLSVAYINDVLRGKRALSDRVLATIGLRREVQHTVTYHEATQ
jgi:DNA-binding transcriptional regulator YdaS (Cro superfamily)